MSQNLSIALGLGLGLLPVGLTATWIFSAADRLEEAEADPTDAPVALAQADERGYCTPELKTVLRRVLTSCGLVGADGTAGRGCQPANAKTVATMSGEDFNSLFVPLADRASIIQFDLDDADLDGSDKALVEKVFASRGGASWFLVVSRSSPDGAEEYNRNLSEKRGRAVLDHLQSTFADPELEREVGMLWLGEEFAQLDKNFCSWNRSGEGEECTPDDINRSAFMAWIDCRL